MKQTCKQCGKEFELTQGEISFYESKGLDLPKRCKECREVNKKDKAGSSPAKHETLTTEKTGAQAGWPLGKLLATGIAAVAIVVAALFGGGLVAGITPGELPTNTANVSATNSVDATKAASLHFRNNSLLSEHYEKHGKDMGFASAEEYERAAANVAANANALHKTEQEDGDDVYYLESTREFVVVSTDGYIRTYYYADKDYFERQ